jgi:hypothetical protein
MVMHHKETESPKNLVEKLLVLIEAFCNVAFFTMAVFIVLLPPLSWFSLVGKRHALLDLAATAAILLLAVVIKPIANFLIDLFQRIRKDELLAAVFRPLRAISAVVTIYGVLALEYKVIHGQAKKTLFEVFCELMRSL